MSLGPRIPDSDMLRNERVHIPRGCAAGKMKGGRSATPHGVTVIAGRATSGLFIALDCPIDRKSTVDFVESET